MSEAKSKRENSQEMPVGINQPLYQSDIAATDLISDAVEEMMDEIEEEFTDHEQENNQ
ncbi:MULTISPECIES: hypothetical protein [unclassified Paenibacillus]|uniref:hypothetical protein n=1 Tax=unclassified Paenibacillus TaxID=185978 RepID=UPI0015C48683|nr:MULTISPECIES: hypothetical protein [unclassified Paenibacillus]MBE1443038.1 hypothetical protein [Paenibacillus sp. OAS669]